MLERKVSRPYTRTELEHAIDHLGYGVILPDGRVATSKAHLPGALALAVDDPEQIAQIRDKLKAERAQLDQEIAAADRAESEAKARAESKGAEAETAESHPVQSGDVGREQAAAESKARAEAEAKAKADGKPRR